MMDDDFDGDDDGSSELAPMAQIITSACWLTVKEGSLLTGDAMDFVGYNEDIFSG